MIPGIAQANQHSSLTEFSQLGDQAPDGFALALAEMMTGEQLDSQAETNLNEKANSLPEQEVHENKAQELIKFADQIVKNSSPSLETGKILRTEKQQVQLSEELNFLSKAEEHEVQSNDKTIQNKPDLKNLLSKIENLKLSPEKVRAVAEQAIDQKNINIENETLVNSKEKAEVKQSSLKNLISKFVQEKAPSLVVPKEEVKADIKSNIEKSAAVSMRDFLSENISKEGGQSEFEFKDQSLQKVINLDKLSEVSPKKLISEITNHLTQMKFSREDKMDVNVRHHELGSFQINVQKVGNKNQLDLKIVTQTIEGNEFFQAHSAELSQKLQDKGIQISSFKVLGGAEFKVTDLGTNSSFENNQSEENSQQSKQQFNGQQKGNQRRQQLWQYYQEKLGA